MQGDHGCAVSLYNNGNDGGATVDEDANGNIIVSVNGDLQTVARLTIMVNGREVVVPDA